MPPPTIAPTPTPVAPSRPSWRSLKGADSREHAPILLSWDNRALLPLSSSRLRPGRTGLAALLAALALGAGGCAERPAPDDGYARIDASPDGTGKVYLGREIARVMGHRGAAWLERPGRERSELPDRVVDALALEPEDVVADIGAGTGYFSFRLAPRVPRGRVLAVDIQPEMLDQIAFRKRLSGATNVEPVLGTLTDPKLPPDAVDLALLVDAYHEFSHPREMMEGLRKALRPGGRVVLVEYRAEDPSVRIKPLHKMTEAQVRLELEAVGFAHVETLDFLPSQHFIVFEKPALR